MGPKGRPDTRTDWPTDRRSHHKFDFDFQSEFAVLGIEKLVAEAGDSSEVLREGDVRY
jgi:hypothetical protein